MRFDFKKSLFILSLLLILSISLGVASASDDVDVSNCNIDNVSNGIGEFKDNSIIISSQDGANTTNKTFKDIQDLIDNANEGDSIEISGEYIGTYWSTINVNKSLTIYGSGDTKLHTKSAIRLLQISAPNVIIKNIIFENGSSFGGNDGGAIYAIADNVSLINCTFNENYAANDGGAIFLVGNNSIFDGCVFNQNTAGNIGGAININGNNSVITNCIFRNNAAKYAGTVFWNKKYDEKFITNVSNCNIISSFATIGGAFSGSYLDSYFFNCNFTDCFTNYWGIGGAMDWEYSVCCLDSCSFINCSAEYTQSSQLWAEGGAIFFAGTKGNMTNCSFKNCYCNSDGGALYADRLTDLSITYCSFINCSVGGNGGAIFTGGDADFNISNSIFDKCSAVEGGAIILGDIKNIINCTFYNNSADSGSDIGSNSNVNISNSIFYIYDNHTKEELVVVVDYELEDRGNKFIKFTPSFKDLNNLISNADSEIVLDCDYKYDEDIYSEPTVLHITKNNFVIDGNGHTIDGSNKVLVFWVDAENVTIKNINLINAYCWNILDGGAIYWDSFAHNGKLINCTFRDCVNEVAGGAIGFLCENGAIINCSFINCHAHDSGGAISGGLNNCSILNSTFVNNSAIIGGAICWSGSNFIMDNCVFKGNNGTRGTIHLFYNYNCTLTNNWLTPSEYIDNETSITLIKPKIIIDITKSGNYYKATTLTIKVLNYLSKPVVNETIVVKIGNNTVKLTTNSKGIVTYLIPYVPGSYLVTANISNVNLNTISDKLSVKINKAISSVITPTKLTTTYNSGKYFKIKVVSKDKKPMVGVKLKLKIFTGKKYKTVYVTTGSEGIAKYSASKLSITTHKVIVSSSENTKYMYATAKTTYIIVKKGTTTVSAPIVKHKKGASKYFRVTIKNKATGKVLSGLYLKIKVYTSKKYKTYTVKSNSKGIAQINTKSLKKGTHKVVISTTSKYYVVSKSGKLIIIN